MIKNNLVKLVAITVLITILVTIYYNLKKPSEKIKSDDGEKYSLSTYSLDKSPLFKKLSKNCIYRLSQSNALADYKLIRNDSEVIIENLLDSIFKKEQNNENSCYEPVYIKLIASSSIEGYLYLQVIYIPQGTEASGPLGSLKSIYQINVTEKSINELKVGEIIKGKNDTDGYKILPDHRKIITWNTDKLIYLDLKNDSSSILYTAPEGKWIVSGITEYFGTNFRYDLNISENQITVGLYEKNIAKNGDEITYNKNYGYDTKSSSLYTEINIETKFVKNITIQIPD